jgi:hypothetical protein
MAALFHTKALALLDPPPAVSEANLRVLSERECRLGIRFPASVREWYSLEGSVALLRRFSNDDHPVELDRLGAPAEEWYGAGPRDFVAKGLLWIMTENQGVCNWAVKLDGRDDPPVVVEVDSAPNEAWLPLADTFSEFVYCQVWDYQQRKVACSAQEIDLADSDLDYLRRTFEAGPTTASWPGNANLRFVSQHGCMLLWYGKERGTDWFIWADTANQLVKLLRLVWRCGNLSETLYGLDRDAERLLAQLRDAQ